MQWPNIGLTLVLSEWNNGESLLLTSESTDKILWCYHSNESYWALLSCGTVYYAVQGGSNFWLCGWNPIVWPFKWKLLIEQYFPVVLFIMLYKVVLAFESVDEILWCDHSNESYWAILPCGTVYYAVQGGSNFWGCGWNPMVWLFKWKLVSSTFLWYCLLCFTRWF